MMFLTVLIASPLADQFGLKFAQVTSLDVDQIGVLEPGQNVGSKVLGDSPRPGTPGPGARSSLQSRSRRIPRRWVSAPD
jgi:hypothetical protein